MNIRKFLLIAVGTFVIFAILIFVLIFSSSKKPGGEAAPTPIPLPTEGYFQGISPGVSEEVIPTVVISLPPTEKVIINKIAVKNFFPKASQVNPYGDYLLAKNSEYKILYEAQFNLFLISVVSSPFEEIKKKAESEFLKLLEITPVDACSLNVSVTTPLFANREEAGRSYKLSFCEK